MNTIEVRPSADKPERQPSSVFINHNSVVLKNQHGQFEQHFAEGRELRAYLRLLWCEQPR